jgi:membrane protein DedA with SNARE-associated domain
VAVVLTRGVSPGNETAANMLLGTLAAMATSVVSYWVGSSAGSARKDDRLTRSLK